MGKKGKLAPIFLFVAVIVTIPIMGAFPDGPALASEPQNQAPGRTMAQQATKEKRLWITADHTKHEILKKEFRSGAEVTEACLSCHSEAATQFHQTIHWTWLAHQNEKGTQMGKAGYSLNNFCISGNKMQDKGCLSCHPGWNGQAKTINCLACHGQKEINWREAFEDFNAFVGSDDEESKTMAAEIKANIQAAVQAVGLPTRKNCGECHFKGGGGDGVKHGDLDTSLVNANKALDVHMGIDGQDFNCTRCHTTKLHNVAGRIYTAPAATERKSLIQDDTTAKIMCESCHSDKPHTTGSKVNDHTDRVACQSCHIPTFARVNPTKMSWDWSKAGALRDGKPYKTQDEFGKDDYLSIKGQMKWEKNVKPEYYWFNGSISSVTSVDTIDPATTIKISHPVGSLSESNARIFPFKVHHGRQPYDKIHKTLLGPMLSGPNGYWDTLDWQRANKFGQEALGLPYSGEFDFVDTTYVFPTTHMVAPKENALSCKECHRRTDGRLMNLAGFYMPGRDHYAMVDIAGWLLVLGTIVSTGIHGLVRILASGKRGHRS